MQSPSVELPIIVALGVASVFTLLLPVALVAVLCIKKKLSFFPLFIGVAAFTISQMVLRLPLMTILNGQSWYVDLWMQSVPMQVLFVVLVGGLTAGLFEETARLVCARFVLNKKLSRKNVLSFGLGHGLAEVLLIVGLNNFVYFLIALFLNTGMSGLSAPDASAYAAFFAGVRPTDFYLAILERISAVSVHVFLTVLVFKGVAAKQAPIYFLLAVVMHTLFNAASVLMMQLFQPWLVELVLFVGAAFASWYSAAQLKAWPDPLPAPAPDATASEEMPAESPEEPHAD